MIGLAAALCGLTVLLAVGVDVWRSPSGQDQPGPWAQGLLVATALGGLLGLAALAASSLRTAHALASWDAGRASRQDRGDLQLMDLMQVPMALTGIDAAPAHINMAMADLLGIERDGGGSWTWQEVVVAQDWPAFAAAMDAARRTGRQQWLQIALHQRDSTLQVQVHIAPVPDARPAEGHAAAMNMAVLLRPPEATAAQLSIQRLRALLEMAEAEQWQFGQAVHDELGQRLSGMAYFAKTLQRKLEQAQRPEADDAGWLTHLANESMSVSRGLARGLVPVGTDDPGALAAMLAELCQNMGKMFSAQCTLEADDLFDAGGAGRANHLYRAVQELMTNAIKHGGAQHVRVSLQTHLRGQRVRVHNDGASLAATPAPARPGMGLNGVRSRVAHLGGQFSLRDDAAGVLATIELPVEPDPATAPPQTADTTAGPDGGLPLPPRHGAP